MNLLWHIIITQSPWFTLWFTFGVVYSMGLDKCIMIHTHYCNITQKNFTVLKILYALPIDPSLFSFSIFPCSHPMLEVTQPFPNLMPTDTLTHIPTESYCAMWSLSRFFSPFFWPHPQLAEILGPRTQPTPQQWPEPQQWHYWILNLLDHKETPLSFFSYATICNENISTYI